VSTRPPCGKPKVLARRSIELEWRRRLEVVVTEDSDGRGDVALRLLTHDGILVGALRSTPSALRPLARVLTALARELGA
jgi:hypothetical protein